MSIPDRIFRISKAYLNQVRDRIDSQLTDAERELDASRGTGPVPPPTPLGESDADAMMRRAEERIAAARRELESRNELRGTASDAVNLPPPVAADANGTAAPRPASADLATKDDPNAVDFKVLGVPVGSDLSTVTAAYEELARRCDPRRFPEGSAEQATAARILTRINASFDALRRRLDPTSNRFGKLELE